MTEVVAESRTQPVSEGAEPRSEGERTKPGRRFIHIRELDGIRGVAVLMVFFNHICFQAQYGWGRPVIWLGQIAKRGRTGVDLFFVLSGFLITSLLIDARKDASYYHDFYWKRALRILPLYILCLAGLLTFDLGSWRFVLLSFFFLSNFSAVFHLAARGPFWTLAIEEQFYLLWPSVVRGRTVAGIRRWALAVGLAAFGLRFVAAAFGYFDYSISFLHCDGLAFGAFLACWYAERDRATVDRRQEDRLIFAGFVLGLVLWVVPETRWGLPAYAFNKALGQTGITLICGSVIAYVIGHSGERSLFVFRSPLLTFFGLISYALYMSHEFVAIGFDKLRGPLAAGDVSGYVVRLVSILSLTVAVCLISRYLIELPAMSLRRFVLRKPAPHRDGEPPIPLGNM